MKKYIFLVLLVPALAFAAESDRTITVDWGKVVAKSRTALSIQVCPEPPMRRSSPVHDQIYGALCDMKIDYARLQPWYPYPRLGVAELEPPRDGKTSWDFSLIDPIVLDFIAAAELIDYPGQFAGATLVDWENGKPNARYWVVKLLRDHFGPGDSLVETGHREQVLLAQGFVTPKGERKILLVNKRNREITVSISGTSGSKMDFVDQTTGFNPPSSLVLTEAKITLRSQAVAVITVAK